MRKVKIVALVLVTLLFCGGAAAQETEPPNLNEPLGTDSTTTPPAPTKVAEPTEDEAPVRNEGAPVPEVETKPHPVATAPTYGAGVKEVDMSTAQILRNYKMQRAGYVLLGVAFGLCLTGTIIAEADQIGPWIPIGMTTFGLGVSSLISSMFLLGFSRPHHGPRPVLAVSPESKWQSAKVQVGLTGEF